MSSDRRDAAPLFVSKETEKVVLGASLLFAGQAQAFIEQGVRADHFFAHAHRVIWRRITQALKDSLGVDVPTIWMLLQKHGELEDVGPAYVSGLVDGMVRLTDQGATFSRRLMECAVGRQALDVMRRRLQLLEEQPAQLTAGFFTDLKGVLDELAAQLRGRGLPDHVTHISDVMKEVEAALKAGEPSFVDTPWPALNGMLGGGFAPGELTFLGARPGLGKTAMALEIARKAGRRGYGTFAVSREMRTVAIGARWLSQEGEIDATRIRRRNLFETDWHKADVAFERLGALPIYATHANVDVDEIRRIVGLLADEGALGLVIVDYLQLVDAPRGISERRLQVEAVSKALKAMTLDFNVPVLCLSSLARPEAGKAPTLASLRESGNLEHDADTVILLHRPQELEQKTQCIVAKSRNGRTGMVELYFRGEFQRFEEPYVMGA